MEKISFIIIGRNEGWKLTKCLESIFNNINYNSLGNAEVIYVDSNSNDESIKLAKSFGKIKVIRLTRDCNAAIARNVGASNSTGNILFFIDGDMELQSSGFKELFNKDFNLKHDFISGDFKNYYYENSESRDVLSTEMYFKNTEINISYTTGGLFAISKENWELVGGMRIEFRRSQDMDLGLRLSKKDIYLNRLPVNLANHHTVSYRSKKRLWKELFDDTQLYVRSLLYRKNLNNLNMYKLVFSQDYTLAVLILCLALSFIFQTFIFLFLYLIVVILRAIVGKNLLLIGYFIMRDIKVFFGLLFFHPRKNIVDYIIV